MSQLRALRQYQQQRARRAELIGNITLICIWAAFGLWVITALRGLQ